MEPHAATEHRLPSPHPTPLSLCPFFSVLCVIGSTCAAKAKLTPPSPPPTLLFPFGLLVPHFILGQAAGHIASSFLAFFCELADLTVACQIQFSGTTVSHVLQLFLG